MCLTELKNEIKKLSNNELNEVVEIIENITKKDFADVVFVGTLSNGKSTVVNSLLQKDLLPSSIGSTTANLFVIKKGDKNKIVRYSKEEIKEYDLSKEKLKELNSQNFDKIEIYLQDFLYKNIAFIDTPGINDIFEEKETISLEYVPFADVVVFVLDISKGLTKKEKEFFDNKILKSYKDKIFILLNKLDTIDDEGEIPEVLKDYQVFKISAKKALAAKKKNDKTKLKESNFLEFKEAFENYLNSLDGIEIKKRRVCRLLNNLEKVALFQFNETIKNFSLSKEELEEKLKYLKKELMEKEKIVKEAFYKVDKQADEFKKFVNKRILSLEEEVRGANTKEEIIYTFEEFNRDIKNKSLEIFKRDLGEYEIEFDFTDEILFLIDNFIEEILNKMIFVSILHKITEKGNYIIRNLIIIGIKAISGTIKNKINSSIETNIQNIQSIINSEIEKLTNEAKRELEFKELAEVKASIYSIESSKEKIESQKEDIEIRINYLEKEKNNLKNLIKTCKDELC